MKSFTGFGPTHPLIALTPYVNGDWQTLRLADIDDTERLKIFPTADNHYTGGCFEGMKAHITEAGDVLLFCPEEHYLRFKQSCDKMSIPCPTRDFFFEAIFAVVNKYRHTMVCAPHKALYIRPLLSNLYEASYGLIGKEEFYFSVGCTELTTDPLHYMKIWLEKNRFRACPGQNGDIKACSNYGNASGVLRDAVRKGYGEVLWCNPGDLTLQEFSAKNFFWVTKNGEIFTTPLNGAVLPGITRSTLMKLALENGQLVTERTLPVSEFVEALLDGEITQVFGTGTAATMTAGEKITTAGNRSILLSSTSVTDTYFPLLEECYLGKRNPELTMLVPSMATA